ncbi:uncharacterized protein LOC134842201 [Symsagittifera roscoffensis]|uniref:uncharacterized protein LOC134842201 n=1 Tax=Symsagittifera roscoffensis TaxID=84072 RepID=UPI00307BA697
MSIFEFLASLDRPFIGTVRLACVIFAITDNVYITSLSLPQPTEEKRREPPIDIRGREPTKLPQSVIDLVATKVKPDRKQIEQKYNLSMTQSVRDPSNAVVPRDSADKGLPRDVADDGVPTMEYQKSNDGDVPRGPAENLYNLSMTQSVRDPSNAVVPRDSADKGVPRDVADDGVPTMEYQKSNDGDVPRGPAENLYILFYSTSSEVYLWASSAADEDRNIELRKRANRMQHTATDPMERLRLAILARGGQSGIKRFAKSFNIADRDRNNSLSREEFSVGIKRFGVSLGDQENLALFSRFDRDHSGQISFDEFIAHLRPPMSEARKVLIHEAFRKIDRSGDGLVDIEDIRGIFSCREHPKFKSGEWSPTKCFTEWLRNFDDGDDREQVKITFEEFLNYYSGVSASIDSDAYFDLMMRNSWKLR